MKSTAFATDQLFAPLFSALTETSNKFLNNVRESGPIRKIPNFKTKTLVIVAAIVIIVVAGVAWSRSQGSIEEVDSGFVSDGPTLELNKNFNVPIRDKDGKEIGEPLKVSVTTLERVDRVLYKGKPLIARETKDFLVINLEVENSTDNRLTIKPVDFFRLIDSSGKSYAADIQTDPVKVEPISSKKTRTIFIVSEDQKNLKFLIGEIKGGNKETVEVTI